MAPRGRWVGVHYFVLVWRAYTPVDPGDPAPEVDNIDTASLTSDSLTSFVGNALTSLDTQISTLMQQAETGDDPAAMIKLQGLVADRGSIVTMGTNLVAALAQTTQAEVQNIGRGG